MQYFLFIHYFPHMCMCVGRSCVLFAFINYVFVILFTSNNQGQVLYSIALRHLKCFLHILKKAFQTILLQGWVKVLLQSCMSDFFFIKSLVSQFEDLHSVDILYGKRQKSNFCYIIYRCRSSCWMPNGGREVALNISGSWLTAIN